MRFQRGRVIASMLVFTSLFAAGCASKGFNRGQLDSQMGVTKPTYDDAEIKAAYEKKPNLPSPFKLAVYFKTPKHATYGEPVWRWSEDDKAVLAGVAAELKKEGLVADVFPIVSSATGGSEDLKALRLVAAKHQADALLIVSGAGEIDRYTNHAGYSYLLLLPTLFVRGSEADTLFVTSATMWDVKNEYLYLTAEAEETTRESYIAAWGRNDKDLLAEAKNKSVAKLRDELTRMIKGAKL